MKSIGILGLGYIGLPLAIAFSKENNVVAFDLNIQRINNLKKGFDSNNEFKKNEIKKNINIFFTNNKNDLKKCSIFIVAVPTPVFKNKSPNLNFLKKSCDILSNIIKKDDLIIFESTVYPGVTEDICAKLIEKKSKLTFNKDFFCGYSPERINPGDKIHKLENIVKITSGSNRKASLVVDKLYKSIIKAGTKNVSSIKIAEAAKVIENSQRDLNIAYVNELSVIFDKINLDINEILDAAETKWNFLPFRPGLVGGHCIGVDPYYLTYISKKNNYSPKVILSGRSINDKMSTYLSNKFIKLLKSNKIKISNCNILILGASFKENCSDIRNSKVFDIYKILIKNKAKVSIFDPIVNKNDVINEYGIDLVTHLKKNFYDGVIIAVSHKYFINMGLKKIKMFTKKNSVIFDIKNSFPGLIKNV
jgi:UDP-N-acetyl-D-galactosamine dehydrogenase